MKIKKYRSLAPFPPYKFLSEKHSILLFDASNIKGVKKKVLTFGSPLFVTKKGKLSLIRKKGRQRIGEIASYPAIDDDGFVKIRIWKICGKYNECNS